MNGVSWIKLSVDLFSHPKVRYLFRLPYGDKAVLLWLYILTSAGQCNDDGKVYLAPDVPFMADDLAIEVNSDADTVCTILKNFIRLKMVTVDKSGIITVLNWSKYQSVDRLAEIREYNRLAKQKQRAKKKQSDSDEISVDCHGQVRDNVKDKSMTSQHRREKKRKDEKIPQSPPSSNVADYVEFVEGFTENVSL